MKVKIGNETIDPNIVPVMLILTDEDKVNIRNMDPRATKYCAYPSTMTEEEIKRFMKTEEDGEIKTCVY